MFMLDKIANTFNAVNRNIQFTLDVPELGNPIIFLDLAIKITNKDLEDTWHVKPNHSNNSLRRFHSWIPNSFKTNFIKNSIDKVTKRCSTEALQGDAFYKLNERFRKNGFSNVNFSHRNSRIKKETTVQKRNNFLKLDFVSDRLSRKIGEIIKKYDFPIQLLNILVHSKNLKQALALSLIHI